MCKYGYARVSTREQRLDRQINALMNAGLEKKQIVVEKQSGKDFCRQAYGRLIRRMRAGDTLFIVSIDRLGRNYTEILEQWGRITKQIGADVVVLDMPLLDTRKKDKDLTGTFMTDLVLQILSYVAQVERENIHERQAAGIAAAKARGVRFGRKGRPLPENFEAVARQWQEREITLPQALETLQVGRTYFYDHVKQMNEGTLPQSPL